MQEAVIISLGSSQAQTLDAPSLVPFYGFPHDEIVGSEDQEPGIRGAVLEYRLCAEIEKDRGGDDFPQKKSGDYVSAAP